MMNAMNAIMNAMNAIMNALARFSIPLFFSLLLILAHQVDLRAQSDCAVTIEMSSGTVTVGGSGVASGASLSKDDTLEVDAGGSATIDLGGDATMNVGPGSRLFVETSYCPGNSGGSIRLRLIEGTLWAQGSSTDTKVEIATANFLARLGNATLSVNARTLDTSFTIVQGTKEISTREWTDTVDVASETFPFSGDVSTIFAIADRVVVIPWGGRGSIVREGEQATFGFNETHISSKPQEIDQSELLYNVDGTFRGSSGM